MSLRGLGILNFENDHVSGETWFLKTIARGKPQLTVLDVGANTGRYSNALKAICPSATIYAFEPHPQTFSRLRSEADIHGYTALNLGCGDSEGRFLLYDHVDEKSGSEHASLYKDVIQDTHGAKASTWEVGITTIDSFVNTQNLRQIDLLKIDTEGNELKVLRGAKHVIDSGRVEVIHFEFNEMNVVSRTFFKDFYETLPGYRFYRMLPDGILPLKTYTPVAYEIFAFQNIVAISERSLSVFQPGSAS